MFTHDHYERDLTPPDDGALPQSRCTFCERYYRAPESRATDWARFCSIGCEDESADVERVR